MKKKKKQSSNSLTIKLIITAVLGALGVMYIMEKPPTAEIRSYQKEKMAKPYRSSSSSSSRSTSSFSTSGSNTDADSDAISLTGKSGRYSEHSIGKSE